MTMDNHDGLPMALPEPRQVSTQTIPLPRSHIRKTQSELQLCEDMELAEYRELSMFYRVVNGIRQRQKRVEDIYEAPYERAKEEAPAVNGWPENDSWSISGFPEDRIAARTLQHQLINLPEQARSCIPFSSSRGAPIVIEESLSNAADTTSVPEDEFVFFLDL